MRRCSSLLSECDYKEADTPEICNRKNSVFRPGQEILLGIRVEKEKILNDLDMD